MVTTNPCEADRERRQRAATGSTLISRDGPMERHIAFEVGYDHTAHPDACGGGGHGRHGMTLRFVLKGPSGATQFVMNMPNWTPGNTTCIGGIEAINGPSLVPIRWPIDDGELLDGAACYYDGSGLNAGPVLEAFLSHGPMAVWAALARYYADIFDGHDQDEELAV